MGVSKMPNWANIADIAAAASTADSVHVDILTSVMMAAGKSTRGNAGINLYIENFTDPAKIRVIEGIYDQDGYRVLVP